VHDLAIIVVSTNEAHWLRRCLTTIFEHAGDVDLDVVVADNESTDGTRELVESEFPLARVVPCVNRGFAHANNSAWRTCHARYALFLNPDTEILDGTFERLVSAMDERPTVGLAGVRQVTADGALSPTIRRSPNALRMLGEAVWSERLPFGDRWLRERRLDLSLYDREVECDWTSGSFMLARREALESSGLMDERSFIYGEEPDLCLRMQKAGWRIVHLPTMTILHHAGKAGVNPKMEAQNAIAKLHFARKHFGRTHRIAFDAALILRYLLRGALPGGGDEGRSRRAASLRALRTISGFTAPPFGEPVPTAVPAEPTAAEPSLLPLQSRR
jgi:hypothetical protein